MLDRLFHLRDNQTDVRRELVAGLTTFAAMAYILAVNPQILAGPNGATGMPPGAVLTATALAAALTTIAMALLTNYPIALAPGMGLNAFFTFGIVLGAGVPWQGALGLVFWEGLLFLLLSVTGIRRQIVDAIPHSLKIAISCGIGLFIAFIGLKNGGLIAADAITFVKLGNLREPAVLMVLAGIILTAILIIRKVRGAIILVVLALTLAGLFVQSGGKPLTSLPASPVGAPAPLTTFLQLDLAYLFTHFNTALPLMLTLLFVDLFDNLGTLIAVCKRAGLLDEKGNLPGIGRALAADAGAAMLGAVLGTSTTTSYIESAAGVAEGGRTGLTGITVAVFFLAALFLTPLILAIPAAATAPALVIVGIFMMQGVREIDLADFATAVPAVLTMLVMPLSFSISEGIAVGFVAYVLLHLGLGRIKEVSVLAYVLAALFLLHFLTR
ncbi:guanine permease [Verrucomicrobia bacterium SCGC AG-212-E04]|nr:guanine permease [Verrucomicrobia bacterium SCGC AG-212-E04]